MAQPKQVKSILKKSNSATLPIHRGEGDAPTEGSYTWESLGLTEEVEGSCSEHLNRLHGAGDAPLASSDRCAVLKTDFY